MRNSPQPLAVRAVPRQAMLLVQQHNKAAMLLALQRSSPVLLERLNRTPGLEEGLGHLGALLAALLRQSLLHRQTLACGPCADRLADCESVPRFQCGCCAPCSSSLWLCLCSQLADMLALCISAARTAVYCTLCRARTLHSEHMLGSSPSSVNITWS